MYLLKWANPPAKLLNHKKMEKKRYFSDDLTRAHLPPRTMTKVACHSPVGVDRTRASGTAARPHRDGAHVPSPPPRFVSSLDDERLGLARGKGGRSKGESAGG